MEQIRKNGNFATFLVENVSPSDTHRDVELSADNKVSTWISFNHQSSKEKILLKTIDSQTKAAGLKRIVPVWNIHPRYGLKFEQKEENVYKVVDIKNIFFRSRGTSIVLTFTFLVGRSLRNTDDDHDDDDDEEMVPVACSSTNDGGGGDDEDEDDQDDEEQFILNDFHWSEMHRPVDNFRGVSIVNHRGGGGKDNLFDLYLHGAVSGETGGKENRLLIARNLKKSQFYTLQVKWGAEIVQVDKSVRILPSFYAIHYNGKCTIKQSFQNTLISDEIRPAFCLGGFVSRTRNTIPDSSSVLQQNLPRIIRRKSDSKQVKSKCFTGLVCNLEILKTRLRNVPPELLDFIVKRQSVRNRPRPPPSNNVEQFIKKDVWMTTMS